MPTGSGKSILAAEVAAACPDPILVVQPTKELLEQNLEKYRLLCGDLAPAGVYSASFGKKEIDHVTFATIGSIKAIGNEFRRLGFRKMLIDEAHLYPRREESMLGEFLRDSGIRQVLGITATPLKLEQFSQRQGEHFDKWSELVMLTNPCPSGTFFKNIIHVCQVQEMISLGFWSKLRYEVIPFERGGLRINNTGSDYTEESVVTAYEYNNVRENILAALDYHTERRHVIVFVPSVEEAEILAQYYPESAMICGETPRKERAEKFAKFKSGEIRVLFGVSVFGTGFDYTKIDMVIMALSTASIARYYQYLGRGVRIDDEKHDCVIVDAGGNYQRFGRIEDIRFEYDQRWRMYGTGGRLMSGIPVDCLGSVTKADVQCAYRGYHERTLLRFGKHKGKYTDQVPVSYMKWYISNPGDKDRQIYDAMLRSIENHCRDTRMEPPMMTMPDGKHAGESIAMIPRGYLKYYYGAQSWNETNDSLRRGIEMYL